MPRAKPTSSSSMMNRWRWFDEATAERIRLPSRDRAIGFEALDLFGGKPQAFQLVLLDLTMPFMDGEETFHRLREIRAEYQVVLCAGFIRGDRLDRLNESRHCRISAKAARA